MSNIDINVDRRTDGRTDGLTDGRTENRTPISHPATSRCDKNSVQKLVIFFLFLNKNICCGYSLETPQGVKEVLLMSTHNVCFY